MLCGSRKDDALDTDYLGFWGLKWYLLVDEIDRAPRGILVRKIAEKVEIGRFYAIFYTQNAVFLHKKLKNYLELIEGHPTRF